MTNQFSITLQLSSVCPPPQVIFACMNTQPRSGFPTRLSWNIIVAPTNYNHGHGKQLFCYIIDGSYLQYPSGRLSTETSHITPSQLWSHRISHRMLGPCCFCPLADPYAPGFVESAIYRRTESPYMGEWVATCARNKCGYFGEQS